MADLEHMTLKQLQEEAVKVGIPQSGVESFSTRQSLITTINALNIVRNDKAKSLDDTVDDDKSAEKSI